MTRAPLVLSKHLWFWPLLGAVLISLAGMWTRSVMESTVKTELVSRMQTLRRANVTALGLWFSERESDAKSLAADVRVREAAAALASLARTPDATQQTLADSSEALTLKRYLEPWVDARHYVDYVVVAPDRRILACSDRAQIDRPAPEGYLPFIRRALAGQVLVSRPFVSDSLSPQERAQGPTMVVASPVRAADGKVVAVLGLRMRPEKEFSRIFSVGRMGENGEAYAFDSRGVMLTASRFDDDLRRIGLITNTPDSSSILTVQLLDPGVDLESGEHPLKPRYKLPLTRMAAAATTQWDGYDVNGYRNYLGVKVIGAWQWLPDYGFGVAVEVPTEEAFQTLYLLRRVFLSLFLLLILSGIAIFAFSLLVERLEASLRKSALAARRLGQYVLVQEIGRGANGMVYRARHTLLRRPVAIKLLSPDLTNESTAANFEQEVQMTSQLTHPNTVAIYDYGRTPEGLFYYAMEYLSGIDLHRLVRQFGPQPEARVIHILRQVCGSLAEAHRTGLIHRDIKPANIVLTRRGGVCDLVKVLDFGLVKAVNWGSKGVAANAVVGTPHFMSPEAIQEPEAVDARSDLYSVGAVGYWLLTGKTLFANANVKLLLDQQAHDDPTPLSDILPNGSSPDLHQLIMRCLARNPDDRPQRAEILDEALEDCAGPDAWTPSMAEAWWQEHMVGVEIVPAATMPEKTLVIAPRA